eukprot:3075192-Rhodomonas_salina.4
MGVGGWFGGDSALPLSPPVGRVSPLLVGVDWNQLERLAGRGSESVSWETACWPMRPAGRLLPPRRGPKLEEPCGLCRYAVTGPLVLFNVRCKLTPPATHSVRRSFAPC